MGLPTVPPRSTERAAARGAAVDRIPASRPGTAPGTSPLARITKPGNAPPPVPGGAKTVMGVPAGPRREDSITELGEITETEEEVTQTRPATEPPTRPDSMGWDDLLPPTNPAHQAQQAPTLVNATPPHQAPTLIQGLTGMAPLPAPRAMTPTVPVPSGPVVLDVTPRGLGIGTVAGYCEELIRRNSRLPAEIKRNFTTSRDKQDTVRIRVCQGESRRIDENLLVGELVLEGLEPRPRGETTIEVTFAIDASGVLQVRARDARTGQERRASLDILGAQSPAEVDAARQRLRELRT
jgi:molecular chaperone DnaK